MVTKQGTHLGVMVPACHCDTSEGGRGRREDGEFKDSLGYVTRPHLNSQQAREHKAFLLTKEGGSRAWTSWVQILQQGQGRCHWAGP